MRLGLIMAALACVLGPLPAIAQVYRWTDETGAVHMADDLNQVPEAYRQQAERMSRGLEGGSSRPTPASATSARGRALAPHERWRGRTFAEWQEDLRDPAPRGRAAALSALALFGEAAVPRLVEGLRDPDADVRVSAARGIGQVGREAAEASTALVRALRDGEPRVRFDAAVALGRVGAAARDAVPALARALTDPAGEVRVGAALGLAGMGSAARDAVPALLQALRDGNVVLRMSACWALGSIGPDGRAAVPALRAALRDHNTSVRTSAASALGGIGPAAREAVPELRRLAESDRAQDLDAATRDSVLRQKEGVLREELRVAARDALRQIEAR
jgi:HEAT repeat protein